MTFTNYLKPKQITGVGALLVLALMGILLLAQGCANCGRQESDSEISDSKTPDIVSPEDMARETRLLMRLLAEHPELLEEKQTIEALRGMYNLMKDLLDRHPELRMEYLEMDPGVAALLKIIKERNEATLVVQGKISNIELLRAPYQYEIPHHGVWEVTVDVDKIIKGMEFKGKKVTFLCRSPSMDYLLPLAIDDQGIFYFKHGRLVGWSPIPDKK